MKAGSMEGMLGANNNIRMTDGPMRFYHEAARKIDPDLTERSMEYTEKFTQKAHQYRLKAQKALLQEQLEEWEEQKQEQEEALERQWQETEDSQDQTQVSSVSDQNTAGNSRNRNSMQQIGKNQPVARNVMPDWNNKNASMYSSNAKTDRRAAVPSFDISVRSYGL